MISRSPARVPDDHLDSVDYGANAWDGHALKSARPAEAYRLQQIKADPRYVGTIRGGRRQRGCHAGKGGCYAVRGAKRRLPRPPCPEVPPPFAATGPRS
jgi:hypothetical protein